MAQTIHTTYYMGAQAVIRIIDQAMSTNFLRVESDHISVDKSSRELPSPLGEERHTSRHGSGHGCSSSHGRTHQDSSHRDNPLALVPVKHGKDSGSKAVTVN